MSNGNDTWEQMHIAALDGPRAARLADLGSIVQDLAYVMGCCEHLIPMVEEDSEPESVLVEALWSAAVIGYCRCFATGKRHGLDEDVLMALSGDPVGFHRFVREMRDKRVAHSVNPFEQVRVGAVLPPPGTAGAQVEGIATLSMRYVASSVEGVRGLLHLARTLRERVLELGRAAEQEALAEAREIPVADLYNAPDMRVVAPDPGSAGRAR